MKLAVFLIFVNCLLNDAQLFKRYYHTNVECAGSMTCIRPFCYLEQQENYESTINTGCILLRPLTKIYVQQVTKERYGPYGKYRPIISYPPEEWCKVMLDSAVNPIYKLAVQAVANSVPELFHICPYWGPVNAYNMTLNMDKIFALFSPGDYSNTLLVFDDSDSQIFKIKVFTRVR